MIAQIRGVVAALGVTWVVVDVHGLGLRVSVPPATSATLRVGEEARLHTCLLVRDDDLSLYGFATAQERECFELCRSANGVGPKLALAIVGVLSPGKLAAAVRSEDLATLCTVPGVGRKSAQKLVIELKDKMNHLAFEPAASPSQATVGQWREQILEGLESLGWTTKDAEAACQAVAPLAEQTPSPTVPVLMKAALASLARL
ncbi:holliday junction DNA helicase RuvA [Propionibacterium cyclohexanicum]|uniref:Holliday junction branch migration complex subunit RuvA n=1 Tax=Propionibacterium cyclohexanicum TaxID=64702 RepID=A0A1H9Q3C5_9ACTN|nr:Holliday junction branch migration protein RuvA [Propionibacterium cyclohexanicum]SER54924.1 holliday junction DNA helicase RuvA [Propionibacterium cyclohexanicum]